jgi:hypothetical protein
LFAPDATSPRAARRFVGEVLRAQRWPSKTVEDAQLVASELATNALIHAATSFLVTVEVLVTTVRITVSDGSELLPRVRHLGTSAPIGRGLTVVGALASRFGASATDAGKKVWAEVDLAGGPRVSSTEAAVMTSSSRAPAPVADRSTRVRFLEVPVAAYLALEMHDDATMRELLLVASSGSSGAADRSATSLRLAAIAERVLRHWNREKDDFRVRVEEAEERGAASVDLVGEFSPGATAAASEHAALLEEVEELRRQGELLGPPPDPVVPELRRWFVDEMRAQVEEGRAPRPFGAG